MGCGYAGVVENRDLFYQRLGVEVMEKLLTEIYPEDPMGKQTRIVALEMPTEASDQIVVVGVSGEAEYFFDAPRDAHNVEYAGTQISKIRIETVKQQKVKPAKEYLINVSHKLSKIVFRKILRCWSRSISEF